MIHLKKSVIFLIDGWVHVIYIYGLIATIYWKLIWLNLNVQKLHVVLLSHLFIVLHGHKNLKSMQNTLKSWRRLCVDHKPSRSCVGRHRRVKPYKHDGWLIADERNDTWTMGFEETFSKGTADERMWRLASYKSLRWLLRQGQWRFYIRFRGNPADWQNTEWVSLHRWVTIVRNERNVVTSKLPHKNTGIKNLTDVS